MIIRMCGDRQQSQKSADGHRDVGGQPVSKLLRCLLGPVKNEIGLRGGYRLILLVYFVSWTARIVSQKNSSLAAARETSCIL
jgi:hypothetical protein